MRFQPAWSASTLSRIVIAVAMVAATTGTALAIRGGPSAGAAPTSAAGPLTADTPAPCNVAARPGQARCYAIVKTAQEGKIRASADAPSPTALGPSDIQDAYDLPDGGAGQTVAIVDAYGYSSAEDDLAEFRDHFGLPACTTANGCFRKVDQRGGTSLPADDAGWALETALDLDAVSSACPACNILLVEGDDPTLASLGQAVDTAIDLGAKFVSNSYGIDGEDPSAPEFDQHYDHAGAVVAVSSGDTGNVISWPASNPKVVAVGGTKLSRDSSDRGWTESAWGSPTGGQGAGSGCSAYEQAPDFQQSIDTGCNGYRATADIAADADPSTGLAVYDTLGQSGWMKVGGTSLAAPLVTAMYALAGQPAAGDYPASYPYHDPGQAEHLNDVTTGANSACGTLLCEGRPGWDGPTGLGSPHGVAALGAGEHGTLRGTVTDAASGDPIAGVSVSAGPGGYVTRTNDQGRYTLDLRVGSYDLTFSKYGYGSVSASGVSIAADATATKDAALTSQPMATLSGRVTDGSGHGWPLHARVTIPGYPDGPIWTDPETGRYSVRVPQGDYSIDVSTDMSGYEKAQRSVSVTSDTVTGNFALTVDPVSCSAPGYGHNGAGTDFGSWTGARPAEGWTVAGTRGGWRFDNPANRPAPRTMPAAQTGGDDRFAIADSAYAGRIDATLTSPPLDLRAVTHPHLSFDTIYYGAPNENATVEISLNGGRQWKQVWRASASNDVGAVRLDVDPASHARDVRLRFHYTGKASWYWIVDNVFIGTQECVPRAGGLVVGVASDADTGQAVNGGTVSSSLDEAAHPWPEGITETTDDSAVSAGYYWLFVPRGKQTLTALVEGYAPARHTVDVASDQVLRHDISLTQDNGRTAR